MQAELSLVLSQFTCLTDGRTYRRHSPIADYHELHYTCSRTIKRIAGHRSCWQRIAGFNYTPCY